MRATVLPATALLAALALASHAQAQVPWAPAPYPPVPWIPRAPDACGPGWYGYNCGGQLYGPNYNLYPPFQPFNGMIFARQAAHIAAQQAGGFGGAGMGGVPGFPTHPYARSPRDFFMLED